MLNRFPLAVLTLTLVMPLPVRAESVVRISTADGNGTDTTVSQERSGQSLAGEPDLLLQYTPQKNQSQKVYLQFDLTPVAGQQVKQAMLILQPVSGYHGRYDFNVFGLKEQTEDVSGDMTWNSAAGNQPEIGGGYWEVRTDKMTAEDGTVTTEQTIVGTGGLDPYQTTYLGRISVRPGKNQCRLFTDELANFLGKNSGGIATIVLTRATPNPTAMAFASREHPVFDPPQLTLKVERAVNATAPIEAICTHPVVIANKESTIELQWFLAGFKAHRMEWPDVMEDIGAMVEALQTDAPAESDQAVATSLGRLLQNEAAYRAMELTDEEWHDEFLAELRRHPRRSGDLFYAFMTLAGWRTIDDPEHKMTMIQFKPFLQEDLSAAARSAIVEWVADIEEMPAKHDPASRMAYYRQHIPHAFGGPSEPYILIQYVKALREAEGDAAAAAFLDQMMTLLADDLLGSAAALLRVSGEPDQVIKDGLIIKFVEEQPGSQLAATLSPYFFGAMYRQGRLHEAFAIIDSQQTVANAKTPEARADARYQLATSVESAQGQLERFPRGHAVNLQLGNVMSPVEACTALAEQYYANAEYDKAIEATLGAIRNAPIRIPRLDGEGSVRKISDLNIGKNAYELQTAAALLISRCYENLNEERGSRKWLRDAEKVAPNAPIKAYVLFLRARQDAGRGRADPALAKIEEASGLVSTSPVLIQLTDLVERSRPQPGSGIVMRKRIDETLAKAKTSERAESVQAYLEAADLARQIGQVERAVTAYQSLAEQHADAEQAAPALASAVRLLESQNRPTSLIRAEAIRAVMVERFGENRVNELLPQADATGVN